jgi:glycosyltransferase involved in cell wall biosynthesis
MENKITFIIPSLNRPTIVNSIESLLKQTNPNWECIVIYDGVDGPDFKDDRIKIIKIDKTGVVGEHNGQSGLVRNIGIKEVKKCSKVSIGNIYSNWFDVTTTEWIGFLDDDDTLHQDYVKDLFGKYSHYDFVVWRMIYNNGRILPPPNNDELSFGSVGISFCFKNKFGNLLFENNRNGEDYDMVTKLKSLTSNFMVAPEVYYNVRH